MNACQDFKRNRDLSHLLIGVRCAAKNQASSYVHVANESEMFFAKSTPVNHKYNSLVLSVLKTT
jgi:hypothetical protein